MRLQNSETRETFLTRLCCHAARSCIPAERYLAIGQTVCFGLQHDFSIETIALAIQMPIGECRLAQEFSKSSTSLKFRALVERWSWRKIVRAMADEKIVHQDDQPLPITTLAKTSLPSLLRPIARLPRPMQSRFPR